MRPLPSVLLTLVLSTGLLLAGCDSGGSNSSGGTLAVKLTDAPGDIVQAEVTIEEVTAVPVEDTSDGDTSDRGGAEASISVLTDSSFTTDLTTLQGGVTTLLGEVQLEPGTYSQIRLKTAREASVMYEDTTGTAKEATLMLPSAEETGVKINFEPVTLDSPDDRAEVTLDFSVEESFVEAGQTGTYVFKPVVNAEAVVVNGETTASAGS